VVVFSRVADRLSVPWRQRSAGPACHPSEPVRQRGEDDEIDLLPQTVEVLETWLAVRPRYEGAPDGWLNPEDGNALFVTVWRGRIRA
jgi:hypothetical protein